MGSLKRSVSVAILAGAIGLNPIASAQGRPPTKPPASTQKDSPATTAGAGVAADELSDDAELARVKSLVDGAQYEQCAAELSHLLDPKDKRPLRDPELVETARVYQATCFIGLGKPELGDEPLKQAIRANPQMRTPDSLIFPQRVIERFLRVREGMYAELRAAEQAAIEKARRDAAARQRDENERWARMLMLERLAREEVVVVKNRRWVGLVPFGVGQFQNGNQPLGWLFLGTEAALGVTALTALAVHTHLQSRVDAAIARGGSVEPGVNPRLSDWHLALELSTYGLLAVSALGIAEAQLSFVPEVRATRERRLPKVSEGAGVRLSPRVAGRPGGLELGLAGTF